MYAEYDELLSNVFDNLIGMIHNQEQLYLTSIHLNVRWKNEGTRRRPNEHSYEDFLRGCRKMRWLWTAAAPSAEKCAKTAEHDVAGGNFKPDGGAAEMERVDPSKKLEVNNAFGRLVGRLVPAAAGGSPLETRRRRSLFAASWKGATLAGIVAMSWCCCWRWKGVRGAPPSDGDVGMRRLLWREEMNEWVRSDRALFGVRQYKSPKHGFPLMKSNMLVRKT